VASLTTSALSLSGRTALVTGGARGLGRAEAEVLAARGANVVVADIADPAQTVESIVNQGGNACGICLDLAESPSVEELFAFALTAYGDVDVVVNNAGMVRDGMSFNLSLEDWDAVLAVNLTAPFLLSRLCARHWRERHRTGARAPRAIINTSSESGLYGNAGQANYAAAKAGLAALTVTLATELEPYGVRVNAIAPRARTDMSERAFGELAREARFDPYSPVHVAAIVAWLASEAAAGVTGNVFVVHGAGVELLEGWRPRRRLERDSPWSDAELVDLRNRLFSDEDARRVAPSIRDLFFTSTKGRLS
jgi:NAD(P)-dependent dehydrogenase (short-subunit alcohol dehydrogenase family)